MAARPSETIGKEDQGGALFSATPSLQLCGVTCGQIMGGERGFAVLKHVLLAAACSVTLGQLCALDSEACGASEPKGIGSESTLAGACPAHCGAQQI